MAYEKKMVFFNNHQQPRADKVYAGPHNWAAQGLASWNGLLIAANSYSIWAWDKESTYIKWVYEMPTDRKNPDYYLGTHASKFYIEQGKIICPVRKLHVEGYYYPAYIVILDAETGKLEYRYCDNSTWGDPSAINVALTTVSGGQIITCQSDGLINCYDHQFKPVKRYQNSFRFNNLLTTDRYIVAYEEDDVAIYNRTENACNQVIYCETQTGFSWKIASAYIDENYLICGVLRERNSKNAEDFLIIDLEQGKIIERYSSDYNVVGEKNIDSIVMKGNDVFFIHDEKLYYSDRKNSVPIFLDNVSHSFLDRQLSIQDNYLFVKHGMFWGKGNDDLTIWNIKTRQKIATIDHTSLEKPLLEDGYLFTNKDNLLIRYVMQPSLALVAEESLIPRASL